MMMDRKRNEKIEQSEKRRRGNDLVKEGIEK
jgi:hypothetical protein